MDEKLKGMSLLPAIALLSLAGCQKDSCRQYSKYTCKQLETQTYNVYYYDAGMEGAGEGEYLIGQATGLASCANLAKGKAELRAQERGENWSYVCCLQTSDSSCAEKHR